MLLRLVLFAVFAVYVSVLSAVLPLAAPAAPAAVPPAAADGVITVRSAFPFNETVARLSQAVTGKGIRHFATIDQAALAAAAGRRVRPSTLLLFGNPALGGEFIAANPAAGLDWPVRLLVFEDERRQVWVAYADFAHIARRYGIPAGAPAFATATRVVASLTAQISAR